MAVVQKTEKQIIDDLGEWICHDMEKDLAKSNDIAGLPPVSDMEKMDLIKDVARRIKFYRDNVVTNTSVKKMKE